jgi:hypothetical protein
MRLTMRAYMERPPKLREVAGVCYRVLRIHPGTGKTILQPVLIVDDLAPAECEHDRLRVTRAGIFAGRYMARCLDCGVGGPVVPGGDDEGTRRLAMGALLAAYPRASFRPVVSERGALIGWAELIGGVWCAVASDGRHALGRFAHADEAVAAVMSWGEWAAGPGCAHCASAPLADACRHCEGMVCEGCALASVYQCAEKRSDVPTIKLSGGYG